MSKILIHLDQDLNIYFQNGIQKGLKSESLVESQFESQFDLPVIVHNTIRTSKILSLQNTFQDIWQNLEAKYNFDEVILAFGQKAGFGDSRIIHVWAKSWKLFNPKNNLNIIKITDQLIIEEFLNSGRLDLTILNDKLIYSAPPRIG